VPDPLSDTYLRQVQQRITAATRGPWPVHLGDDGLPCGFGPFTWVEHTDTDPAQMVADIELSAHARTDVRNLYGEVARLKDEVAALHRRLATLSGRGTPGVSTR
jgi:hypothetical protein